MPSGAADRVLVLGATGFLGGYLIRELNAADVPVAVYRRKSSRLDHLAGCRFTETVGELDDAQGLRGALAGCRAVFNLAATTSLLQRDAAERRRWNCDFVGSLADLLLAAGPVRLVHCSTAGAVGLSPGPAVIDETSPFNAADIDYFATKRAGEDALRVAAAKGLDAVVVNPATIVGPRGMRGTQLRALRELLAGRMWFHPPGGTCVARAADVARGMRLALEKGRAGQRYILGGTNVPFAEFYGTLARLAGVRAPFLDLPAGWMPAIGSLSEALLGVAGADTGRLAARFGWYSSDKAVRELGYSITPFPEVLKELLAGVRAS
ncbi:MAG: hypothetical protein A2X36_15425 [Elusimicrobia bacterium GWA2_69_24]|nr:MAG: hypothetical protein A2X36_15425 [Elusimicrobia bacterium GWA2_69_24]HBL18105.1 hypothetical protein [Elusimicrobiota bacterium]